MRKFIVRHLVWRNKKKKRHLQRKCSYSGSSRVGACPQREGLEERSTRQTALFSPMSSTLHCRFHRGLHAEQVLYLVRFRRSECQCEQCKANPILRKHRHICQGYYIATWRQRLKKLRCAVRNEQKKLNAVAQAHWFTLLNVFSSFVFWATLSGIFVLVCCGFWCRNLSLCA